MPMDFVTVWPQVFSRLSKLSMLVPGVDFGRDSRRIQIFVAGLLERASVSIALAVAAGKDGDSAQVSEIALDLERFGLAAAELMRLWVHKGTHLGFGDLFRDPFKDLRQQTRQFARDWKMSDTVIEALG